MSLLFFKLFYGIQKIKQNIRYGFEINSEKVVSEWLETTTKLTKNRRRRMIFLRKGQEFPEVDESVKDSVGHLINNVRPTALALTVFAQFADPISSQVIKLMNRPNFMIFDGGAVDPMGYALQQYHENPELAFKVLQLLKKLDLSIQDLKVIREPFTEAHLKTIPNELKSLFNQPSDLFRAVTLHKMYGSLEKNHHVEFDFNNQESFGTRRLFVLMTLLVQILDIGRYFCS